MNTKQVVFDEDDIIWTDEMTASAKTFSELPASLQKKLRGVRGKQKAPLKVPTSIRLDADLITALRATGRGWQSRVNEILRKEILGAAGRTTN